MQDQSKFIMFQTALLIVLFGLLRAVFPVGGDLDLSLIHPWISESGAFLLRSDWSLSVLNHRYVKNLLIAVYLLVFCAWLLSLGCKKLSARRFELGYLFWVSMLCTAAAALFKSQSRHACPWSMTLPDSTGFFWDFSAQQGHCFPGGHASLGFALMTGFFCYRLTDAGRARFYLLSGFMLGFCMGWAQMMRGAHFLSHNLWTFWLCWALNTAVYAVCCCHKNQHLRAVPHSSCRIL